MGYGPRAVNAVGIALGMLLAGCAADAAGPAPIPPMSTGKVRVRVFTEPQPVRALASVGRFVFVGTDNHLERWDGDGNILPLSAEHGLSGNRIVALAADPARGAVWILTDGGLGIYDTTTEAYRELPAPPPTLGIDFATLATAGATLAPAADGGAWVGTPHGLLAVTAQGAWTTTAMKQPVRALVRDAAGWLWLATTDGLHARRPAGDTLRIDAAHGNQVVDPRIVVPLGSDQLLVIGTDDAGHERIAIGRELAWTTFRALPEQRWDAAARRGTGAVLMGGDRIYKISPADGRVRPLTRDGMRLVPLVSGATTEWTISPLELVTPPGALALGAIDDQLLVGTRDLGTARYRDGDVRPHDWLRRKQMFRDATALSVACATANDCWIATGARRAWHWSGDRFVAGGPDQIVLAVVRDPDGARFALHRAENESGIRLSRIDGETWTPVPRATLTASAGASQITFARFAQSGQLWVGLRTSPPALPELSLAAGFGVADEPAAEDAARDALAIIDTETGKVSYHRGEGDDALPAGVIDADVRGATAWFATAAGVARMAGGEITRWTAAEGLRSQVARALAIAADGSVFVATAAGAGRWDGKAWDFPATLGFEINDVVATRNGQVWMATERGIAAWDGHKLRRVDTRRGLAENHILDIAVDHFDRVWARGAGSLTLISQ